MEREGLAAACSISWLPRRSPCGLYSKSHPTWSTLTRRRLPMGIVARCVASHFGVPCIVHVQDLFPQNVIDLGMLRNRKMIHFFEAMERHVYRMADAIVVMSEGNVDHVVARGASRDKVRAVSNWVDTDLIKPEERMNGFRRTHQIGQEFVVLFAGTMGWSSGTGGRD